MLCYIYEHDEFPGLPLLLRGERAQYVIVIPKPAKLAANMGQLTAIVDEIFSAQPMAHWREVFDKAHITYSEVQDPQLSARGRWREVEKHDQQSYSSAGRHQSTCKTSARTWRTQRRDP
jgi:crotonobetainyl-CoA:carnitine CoA-transferase CaiB-like acyl-CoA transferase